MTVEITTETFGELLRHLSQSPSEAGVAYTKLRNSLVRFFEIKGDSFPDQAADQTLDRVTQKLSNTDSIEDITKYSFGVARFIFLERLRMRKKEIAAAEEYYANSANSKFEEDIDTFAPLRRCFAKIEVHDQMILRKYFADLPFALLNEKRIQLGKELDISVNNLRLKIYRLRKRLENCVKRTLNK